MKSFATESFSFGQTEEQTFCFPVANHNCGGEMSLSTFLVLIALTFGQIAVLTVTLFVLWLAEEFRGSHE